MTLNCIVIDDEPLAADLLASYVSRTPFLHLVGAYNSAVDAIRDIHTNAIDVAFLDIQMPELNGVELATLLPRQTRVVFTTAFAQYAIESYKANAIGYLLKPIAYDRFLAVAHKALVLGGRSDSASSVGADRFLFVRSDYKILKLPFDNILYIEGLKDYVKFVLERPTSDGQTEVTSLLNMKHLDHILPIDTFMRVHRSYIVNRSKINLIDRSRIAFGCAFVPISETYRDEVQRFIDDHTAV